MSFSFRNQRLLCLNVPPLSLDLNSWGGIIGSCGIEIVADTIKAVKKSSLVIRLLLITSKFGASVLIPVSH